MKRSSDVCLKIQGAWSCAGFQNGFVCYGYGVSDSAYLGSTMRIRKSNCRVSFTYARRFSCAVGVHGVGFSRYSFLIDRVYDPPYLVSTTIAMVYS